MNASIPNTRITAIRAAVPDQVIRIEDELEYYGGSLKKAQRAKAMIGVDKRRLAWPGQTASDLCYAAAKALLDQYPAKRNEIDALVFVSQSPDYDWPATACVLQDRLGLPTSCASFDVNQGCAGYVYGLWLCASLINSGARNILLLAGDAPCRPRPRNNRVVAPIFGDGGSATLLERVSEAPGLDFSLGSDGSGYQHIIVPGGRARLPLSSDFAANEPFFTDINDQSGNPWRLCDTYMDGKAVFAFTLGVIPNHIRSFLDSIKGPEPDYYILHQANRQIVAEVAKKAGLPQDKTPSESFSNYGNLSSASIPAALCDLFGQQGSTGKTRLLLCGFGVGLAWASCLWQADNCNVAPVIDVPAPENGVNSFQDQIKYWQKQMSGEKA